jgi:hypothetical protein
MHLRLLIAPVVAGLLAVGTTAAAGAASPDELITPTPPTGFAVANVPNAINGPVGLDDLARLSGISEPTGINRADIDGAGRTWSAPGGHAVIVIAVRTKSDSSAAGFAAGALQGATRLDHAKHFDSALSGVTGVSADRGIAHLNAISWSQGSYAVIVVEAGTGVLPPTVADDVATREADFLHSHFQVDVAPSGGESAAFRIGYLAGAAILVLALVGIVVALVRRSRSSAVPVAMDVPTFPGDFAAPPTPGTAPAPGAWSAEVGGPAPRAPKPAPAPIPFRRDGTAGPEPASPPPSARPTGAVTTASASSRRPADWDDRF